MEEFITACPRNCYSTCTFRVRVEKNRITKILPFAGNLATPEGPCIKGLSYIERINSSERIIFPLIKNSSGRYSRITSDEALNIISEKLLRIKKEFGPQSVIWYKGSGQSGLTNELGSEFWKAFGGPTTTYGNLCWPAGLEAVRLTLGENKHNVPWDLVNASTIIIWGKNPAETNVQETAFIAKARERGCRVIVIDPVRTPSADKSDLLFSPVPGTDAALALAIARILIKEDLIDKQFIEDHVKGFDEFRKAINLSQEDAAAITGIPENEISELAQIIGKGSPLTIIPGYGLQRHRNGGQTIRSILSLIILTGNIGKPGAGFNYANLQSYIYDNPKEPISYYPDPVKDAPFRRVISMARLGTDMLSIKNPELRAIWMERGNPVLQSPDSFNVRKAFNKLQFRVVVEQFMTDTASVADIILPAKDIFEQSDIIGSYWSPYVQFKPKVIDPPGEVMPESEIYFRLAEKMGLQISNDLLPDPGNDKIEAWLERRIKGYSTLSLADLKKGPVLAPGLQEIAYADMKFKTPSGKIELYSEAATEIWGVDNLPTFDSLINNINYNINNNIYYNLNYNINNSFPLTLLTSNAANRIHSQFGNLNLIKQTTPPAATLMSYTDASKRSISDGDAITLFNEHGEIRSTAKISARIPEGIVVLPNGIWMNEGGGGNHLIAGAETDMGHGAAFHDTHVEVMKTGGNE